MTQGKVINFVCCAILICGMMAGCKGQKPDSHNGTTMMEEPQEPTPSYEGIYLDEDNNEQNLHITFNRTTGHYDIQVAISHLTTLVEGVGEMHDDGMLFTATDTQDNPIEGLITLHNDTAKVCFTKSTWPSIHKGTSFRYTRQK